MELLSDLIIEEVRQKVVVNLEEDLGAIETILHILESAKEEGTCKIITAAGNSPTSGIIGAVFDDDSIGGFAFNSDTLVCLSTDSPFIHLVWVLKKIDELSISINLEDLAAFKQAKVDFEVKMNESHSNRSLH